MKLLTMYFFPFSYFHWRTFSAALAQNHFQPVFFLKKIPSVTSIQINRVLFSFVLIVNGVCVRKKWRALNPFRISHSTLLASQFSYYSSNQRLHTILLNSQYYNTPAPTDCGPHRSIVKELPDGGLRAFVGSNCDNSFRMYCANKFSTNMIPIAW
jgi:hypothetical protein